MLHHFPNKRALVLAAIEDILVRRAEDFAKELQDLDSTDLGQLVRKLWAAVRGPTFVVWLELAVASRTDPVLQAELRLVMHRFDTLVVHIAEATLPRDIAGEEDLHLAVSVVFSALNGLALDRLQHDPDRIEARVELLARWVANHCF